MNRTLTVYNSLTRQKEEFKPLVEGHTGMYVCGPTVYSDVHLGNCRTFVSFDIIYRYLLRLGLQVRYVRNITDVGHLTGDSDAGEDKMSKAARLANLEPMEVAQKYANGFHAMMRTFNTLEPSIEPHATGHIPEQIEMVQAILDSRPFPQQAFNACRGVRRLGQRFGAERLEAACRCALHFGTPRYKSLESILKNGLDRQPLPSPDRTPTPPCPSTPICAAPIITTETGFDLQESRRDVDPSDSPETGRPAPDGHGGRP